MQSKGSFIYEGPSNMQSIERIFKNNGIQLYDSRVRTKDSQNLNVIVFFSSDINLSEFITNSELFYNKNSVWEVLLKNFRDKIIN